MRITTSDEVRALPDEVMRELPAVLLARIRALDIDGTGVVDPTVGGPRRPGLRLAGGRHGRVGAEYELNPAGTPTAPSTGPVLIVVTHDDRHRLRLRGWHPRLGDDAVEVEVERPERPRSLEVHGAFLFEERWPAGGRIAWSASVDLGALGPPSGLRSQVHGEASHPRLRGGAKIRVEPAAAGSWPIHVHVTVRGRGWTRPLVALAALFRTRARDALVSGLADAARGWDRSVVDAEATGPLTAAGLVDAFVADLLDEVVGPPA